MDEIASIVAFFATTLTVCLAWIVYRLRARVSDQETRLNALAARLDALQRPAADTPPPFPETVAAFPETPPPLPETAPPEFSRDTTPRTRDWESVIGGNWLNRVGSLILVIGIALFLGYSLTQLGPAGKVAIGFVTGVSMLGSGMALRKSERYGNFALSLVGGGWAVTYFTAYAAHALEPARVIESPALGGLLLFVASVAMILHALAYGSEQGTAMAFVFSFISINVSPLTGFSIYAALVLAFAILTLAHVRGWFRLTVTGVLLAYATFLLRRDAAEPLAQWALWVQWFAFEAFDIFDISRRGFRRGVERSLSLLNAIGFLGASLLYQWENLGWFLVVSAFAYLLSTVIRARLLKTPDSVSYRLLGGGYEGSLTACALLTAAALVERFSGTNITLALLIEGEMIVVAGSALGNSYVRGLGAAVLTLAFFRIVSIDQFGVEKRVWTPTAALMAIVFGANRVRGGWAYGTGAAVLLAMITSAEVRREWVPFALAAEGTVVLVIAIRGGYKDLRLQHMAWAFGTFLAGWIALDYGPAATASVALTIVSLYACELLVRGDRYAGPLYSVLGTLLLTLLLFEEVQGRLLTVALGVEGATLLIAGMFSGERVLRVSGLVLFLVCIGKVFAYDLRQLDTFSRILSFIVLGVLLLGASWAYTRFRDRIQRLL